MTNQAVVLGANYYIGLSIIRGLGKKGIQVVAFDYSRKKAYGLKSKYITKEVIAPHYKTNPEGFLQVLLDYGKRQDKKPVLFPSADPYVEFIDQYFDQLKDVFLFPQDIKGLYSQVMDKAGLLELAKQHGVKAPESIPLDAPDLLERVDQEIGYPCIIKPLDSAAFMEAYLKKVFHVQSEEDLIKQREELKDGKLDLIVQRIIPGFDDHMYTFDGYVNKAGKVTHFTTCQKHRQYPINFGASVFTQQRQIPQIVAESCRFLEAIAWRGFAEIEWKKDAVTGDFYLIEINVRTTNLDVLLQQVGLNMPFVAYTELTGGVIDDTVVMTDSNIYFWYALEDILAIKDYIKRGQLKWREVLPTFFYKKAYAVWDPRDPLPYLSYFYHKVVKRLLGKLVD